MNNMKILLFAVPVAAWMTSGFSQSGGGDDRSVDMRLECKKALRPLFRDADSLQWNHGGKWLVASLNEGEWLAIPKIDDLPSSLRPGCLLNGDGSLVRLIFI